MHLIKLEDVPADIRNAAQTLDRHFLSLGPEARDWKLLGVCSRNYAYKYEILRDELKTSQTRAVAALRQIGESI